MNLSKKEIRKLALEKRNSYTEEEIKIASEEMLQKFIDDKIFEDYEEILLFCSYNKEIPTGKLIEYGLKLGKKVFIPKVLDKIKMDFFKIYSLADCKKGFMGILEPEENPINRFDYDNSANALIIMPGLAFDKYNNRLGYGGGFYDRYICDKPNLLENSIAIGYKGQLFDELPADIYDLKPKKIMLF